VFKCLADLDQRDAAFKVQGILPVLFIWHVDEPTVKNICESTGFRFLFPDD